MSDYLMFTVRGEEQKQGGVTETEPAREINRRGQSSRETQTIMRTKRSEERTTSWVVFMHI